MVTVQERKKGFALLGDCCKLPFGYLKDGTLNLLAPHTKPGHELSLTANDLRNLANLLDWVSGVRPPPQRW